ncbi:MAG: Type secretion system protein, partial [Bacteroidota bacterium]
MEVISGHLQGGATLSQSLEQVEGVSTFVTNMVAVGEESGQLGEAIQEMASFYEQEGAH